MSIVVGEHAFSELGVGSASIGDLVITITAYTDEVPASDDSDAVPARLTLSDGTEWTKGVNSEVWTTKEVGGRRSRRRRSRRHGGSRKKRRGGSRKKRKGSNKRR